MRRRLAELIRSVAWPFATLSGFFLLIARGLYAAADRVEGRA